jgi:cyclin-dependent kinase 7
MGIADVYAKGGILGKGTFGEVIKGTNKETGDVVAIKKIRIGEKGEGVNVTALREVKYLKELKHPNIVSLLDVIPLKKGIGLVFEYMESDLEVMIKDRSMVLSAADVKAYMVSILQALAHCHERWVVHRDIKPNNFLVTADGSIKLADFGLSRIYGSPERRLTNQVFARWYRAPELLYGSTCYGPGVDMWAAGCVFAELLLRRPWFPGETDIEVLTKIFTALGTPTDIDWGGLRHMPGFVEFSATTAPPLKQLFSHAADDALDLLNRMVAVDPRRRISAADALKHRYFKMDPAPTPAGKLPKPHPREEGILGNGGKRKAGGEEEEEEEIPIGMPKRRRPGSEEPDCVGNPKQALDF